MGNNRVLFFLTAEFPFGKGETFIENEFPFLQECFEQIIIITNTKKSKNSRIKKEDAEIHYFPYELSFIEKILSLTGIFDLEFWRELKIIFRDYQLKISFNILKTILSSLKKKKKISKFIQQIYSNPKITNRDVYAYSYWLNDMAIGIGEFKKNNLKIKTISRAHSWDIYFDRHPDKYLPLRHFLFNYLDKCYTISNHGKNYLNMLFDNAFEKKIKLSRLGTTNKEKLKLFNSNETFQLVSCSSLIPLKRVHLIIEALNLINYAVHWTHIGSGYLQDEVKEMANYKFQNKPNISFSFMGQLSNREVVNFYCEKNVDLFINVSQIEGIPVSIMEALSFGIPCIATDVGGNSEIVNSTNGFLISSNPTAEELKNKLLDIIYLKKEEFLILREHARIFWKKNYNADENYLCFVNELIKP